MKYILLIAGTFAFQSCTKHKYDIVEHIPNAMLTIYSPATNTFVANSDTIRISALAVSDETIHGYDISILKQNDTTTFYKVHVHDHASVLNIDRKWKDTIPYPVNADVIITLILDHNKHTLTRKIPIHIQ
jgi:hypothetical protein